MEMTLSRKVLNISAIMEFIAGGCSVLLCIALVGATIAATHDPELAQALSEAIDQESLVYLAVGAGIIAIPSFVYGFLQKKAAKDPSKIMPVWVLSLIGMVLQAAELIYDITQNTGVAALIPSFIMLLITILVFTAANSIKKAVGK